MVVQTTRVAGPSKYISKHHWVSSRWITGGVRKQQFSISNDTRFWGEPPSRSPPSQAR